MDEEVGNIHKKIKQSGDDDRKEVTLNSIDTKLNKLFKKVESSSATQNNKENQPDRNIPPSLEIIKFIRSRTKILGVSFSYDKFSGVVTCTACCEISSGSIYY